MEISLTDREKLITTCLYIMKNQYLPYDEGKRVKLIEDYSKALNFNIDTSLIYLDIKAVEEYFIYCFDMYLAGEPIYNQNQIVRVRNSEQYIICIIELMFVELDQINPQVKTDFQHFITKELGYNDGTSLKFLKAIRNQINLVDEYIKYSENNKKFK